MLQKLEFLGQKDEKIFSFESVKYMAHRKMGLSPCWWYGVIDILLKVSKFIGFRLDMKIIL
ncbi:hypothetical protein HMPREF3186_01014 [Gemella haemolysans]|uniref:Uncharacterized protein n=1 Tax=Gemella haemolysans TaxID=1379 RepID=A0A133ZW61_9BACL|nr:hypothetical protein HMPREF3186_01014 [Gemella haemolysans]